MKRDIELVKKILLYIESSPNHLGIDTRRILINTYHPEVIHYHINLLINDNLVKGKEKKPKRGDSYFVNTTLTLGGHDFLDKVKDSTKWEAAIKNRESKLKSVSLSVLKVLLEKLFGA